MAARESKFRSALRDSDVPREYHAPLLAWIEQGQRPSDPLLSALITNNLRLALQHAGDSSLALGKFLDREAPEGSFFHPAAWANWPMHRAALARQAEATMAWAFRELTDEDLLS